jgi:hypothetical protein
MVLHQLGHQAVGGPAGRGKALKNLGAGFILVKGPQHGLQLSHDLLGSIDQVQFFSRDMRHTQLSSLNSYPSFTYSLRLAHVLLAAALPKIKRSGRAETTPVVSCPGDISCAFGLTTLSGYGIKGQAALQAFEES